MRKSKATTALFGLKLLSFISSFTYTSFNFEILITYHFISQDVTFNTPYRNYKLSVFGLHLVTYMYLDVGNFFETIAPRGTDRLPEYNEHFCY